MKKSYKPESEDRKYFKRILSERIHEEYKDVNPAEWLYMHDGGAFEEQVAYMAVNWDEARALVDALENTHLDDDYLPTKQYSLGHLMDAYARSERFDDKSGDPYEIVRSQKTRAEILARLAEIAHFDLGDDPDEWRRWFKAWDEDDFFPPVR
ncbi:hypothetical protein JMK10_17565 [Rhodovulum sulfidophilum]|uniref:hypothetical protein n=1 Tax=Rhodovulum sulfidophilum TaxID=35806 RepID=UPI00192227A2|nr:hypothetical protein [Rhodovulum sulfidophilum]MBL3575107.1 hypothetical protein [Rhodovulum sulfidophilum]MCE8430730.1 hypothetical protein [Rhodovulum sulfidophilum]MCF4118569.1 hypothetical protein [Rhodovulum sulfidophilum]